MTVTVSSFELATYARAPSLLTMIPYGTRPTPTHDELHVGGATVDDVELVDEVVDDVDDVDGEVDEVDVEVDEVDEESVDARVVEVDVDTGADGEVVVVVVVVVAGSAVAFCTVETVAPVASKQSFAADTSSTGTKERATARSGKNIMTLRRRAELPAATNSTVPTARKTMTSTTASIDDPDDGRTHASARGTNDDIGSSWKID